MTSSSVLTATVLAISFVLLSFSAAQESCSERCGESYYRGYSCHCDYECLVHQECCDDYYTQCTTSGSCKGRCGETFKRGRGCHCDSECLQHKQCCPDYENHCTTEAPPPPPPPPPSKPTKKPAVKPLPSPPKPAPTVPTKALNIQADPNSESFEDEELVKDLSDNQLLPISTFPSASKMAPTTGTTASLINMNPLLELQRDEFPPSADFTTAQGDVQPSHLDEASQITSTSPSVTTNTQNPQSTVPTEGYREEKPSESVSGYEPLLTNAPEPAVTAAFSITPQSTIFTLNQGTVGHQDILQDAYKPSERDVFSTGPTETSAATNSVTFTIPGLIRLTMSPSSTSTEPASSPEGFSTLQSPLIGEDFAGQARITITPATESETSPITVTQSSDRKTETSSTPGLQTSTSATDSARADTPKPTDPLIGSIWETVAAVGSDITPLIQTTAHVLPIFTTGQEMVSEEPGSPLFPTLSDGNVVTQTVGQTAIPTPLPADSVTLTEGTQDALVQTEPLRPGLSPAVPTSSDTSITLMANPEILSAIPSKNPLLMDKNETNLCSGRPSDGMTTLQNGTIFVFRGHYFWHLSSNGVAGDARLITDVWGIPSPIDTVFTRCNCQGKTFFFKDKQYWRFENGNMDPGYPKLVSIGFGGMSGTISAALSVPAFRRRRETVYFFKRGGLVQKYSYKQEPPKSCSKTPSKQYSIYNVRTRTARQAVYLSNEINIKLKWKGFPSTITSALSLPNTKKPDGYDYFVFSKAKYYNVKIDADQPTLTSTLTSATQQDTSKDWYKCP
ncbi:proteoglycan 4b [Amia ocellicauda]|uniref:proteoglycan 4b n=1 Tax=Amia ocellicauda TaxID=2972642 RepID=UPI0034640943